MSDGPNQPEQPTAPATSTNSVAPSKPQEVIPPGLDTVLRTAGIDPTPEVTKAIEISLMMFRGSLPLPPPPILSEYEKTFPGLTEKIVAWTEEQRIHRQALERQRTDGAEKRMDRGQYIAGGVAIWGLTMAAVAGVWSAPVGVVIAIVAIGGPTAAIWLARSGGQPQSPPPSNVPKGSKPKAAPGAGASTPQAK
jgi:uncharacterized membrane protein